MTIMSTTLQTLRIENIDVPAPAADEVQISVRAIGLNRAEVSSAAAPTCKRPNSRPTGYELRALFWRWWRRRHRLHPGDAVSVIPTLDMSRPT